LYTGTLKRIATPPSARHAPNPHRAHGKLRCSQGGPAALRADQRRGADSGDKGCRSRPSRGINLRAVRARRSAALRLYLCETGLIDCDIALLHVGLLLVPAEVRVWRSVFLIVHAAECQWRLLPFGPSMMVSDGFVGVDCVRAIRGFYLMPWSLRLRHFVNAIP
jgi:hypothetical protein